MASEDAVTEKPQQFSWRKTGYLLILVVGHLVLLGVEFFLCFGMHFYAWYAAAHPPRQDEALRFFVVYTALFVGIPLLYASILIFRFVRGRMHHKLEGDYDLDDDRISVPESPQ